VQEDRNTILILDDEEVCLSAAKLLLKRYGYKIATASNGKDGLDYLAEHRDSVLLILLDINMARMTGIEFLAIVKDDHNLNTIPVILQSAATDEEVQMGLSLGACDYIRKPYTGDALYNAMSKIKGIEQAAHG
jgi:CheY-like chemotaxis protein